MLFDGAGGPGGAEGGREKELVVEGAEGLGATLIEEPFWFSFCATAADDVVGLPPKADLGAIAGGLASG